MTDYTNQIHKYIYMYELTLLKINHSLNQNTDIYFVSLIDYF